MKVGYVITEVDEYDICNRIDIMLNDGINFYADEDCKLRIKELDVIYTRLYYGERMHIKSSWWGENYKEKIAWAEVKSMIENSVTMDSVEDHAFYDLVRMDRNRRRKE